MLRTHSKLLEILGEAELANVSRTFWLSYHDRLDPSKSNSPEAYDALLNFQNGWLACKDFYGVRD